MTYRQALKVIRANTRAGDTLGDTFKIIVRNRDSHPVRNWAIYDLQRAKRVDSKCARTIYDRHLARLNAIFVLRSAAIYGGA